MLQLAHFGPAQADVYIPTVIALTVAAVAIALPLVFAPRLHGGSGRAARILAGVVAVAAVAVGVVLAVPAQRTLAAQVPALQAQIASRYRLHLPDGIVSSLIDGSTVKGDEIGRYTGNSDSVKLIAAPGGYELVGTVAAADGTTPLPTAHP